jgi:hypothetical protein
MFAKLMKLFVMALAAGLFASGTALAQNPHFVGTPTATLDGFNVEVKWKEAGLGSNQNIDYVASAVANATYQCVNKGGNCPQAANKQDVSGDVTAEGTFSSGQNGQIRGTLTIEPPASTLTCPGNQLLEIVAVDYFDIQIADTTNGVTASTQPQALSAAGIVCP